MTAQTALAVTNIQALAKEFEFKESFVQTVKDVFAKGADDNELRLFLQTAKRTNLDPFARQIYCIKRWDSALQKEVMSAQVSIDGFRLIADRSGAYVPSKEPTFNFDKNGNLESATAYIKKFVGGVWHEISATAFYSEYVQTKKDKTPTSMWLKMPRLMLAKCAESLVLRKAFPAELSGLYTPEEMGIAENIPTSEPVQNTYQPAIEAAKVEIVLSPEEKELAEKLNELYVLQGYENNQLVIAKFNALPTIEEKKAAIAKVEVATEEKLRDKIKTIIIAEDFPYDTDGTARYLATFGIDAIDSARLTELKKAVEGFKEDTIF